MMHVKPKGYQGYQGVQAVASAMPSPVGGMPQAPNPRNAQIADLLMSQGMDASPIQHWTQGLAKVGKALIGRRMANKAEKAEQEYSKHRENALHGALQSAGKGDVVAALMAAPEADRGLVSSVLDTQYRRERDQVSDQRYDQDIAHRDRVYNYGVERDRLGDHRWKQQFEREGDWRGQDVAHRDRVYNRGVYESDRAHGLSEEQLQLKRDEMEQEAGGAGTAPSLSGLPSGVQSAIVNNEQDIISAAEARTSDAQKAARLAQQFVTDAKGYRAQGGGLIADIGQVFSNRTAGLKGITAEMIPMMRSAGEGIMTDADAKRYEQAVVSINKPNSSNQAVRDTLQAGADNAAANERFLRNFQAEYGYGSVNQAERLWDEYSRANPVFGEDGKPVKERVSIEDWLGGSQITTPEPVAVGTEVDGSQVSNLTDGTVVQGADGKRYRVVGGQLQEIS